MISGICCGLQRRLLLWRRRGWEVVGDRTWKHLGKYSGWMCVGCVAGAVAFAINMRNRALQYESESLLRNPPEAPSVLDRQYFELTASRWRHSGVFHTFYSMQLLCTIFAMNMLLRRVSDHASHR